MRSCEWQFHARGGQQTLVLLPGWATDIRIFGDWVTDDDLVTPQGMLTGELVGLADFLTGLGGKPVVLVGWSLGGFAAAEFACRHPHLVAQLVLVGIRQRYPAAPATALRDAVAQDPRSALPDFYRRCFLPAQREDYRQFRRTLEPAYLEEFATDDLLAGLDYLLAATLTPAALPPCPTTIIHGAQDYFAPVEEARQLGEEAGVPVHVLPDISHAVCSTAAGRRAIEECCRAR
ncbi:MAG: alpha/beta fold hydrolase [Armatimonadota bacterium]